MPENRDEIIDLRNESGRETSQRTVPPAEDTISWSVEEFTFYEKDPQWFMVGGIIALGIFLSLLVMKSVFGAATILLFVVILYLYATKKPDILNVRVDSHGVSVNHKLDPYSSLTSFWILYEPPIKDLILIHKAHFSQKVIIPLGDANPVRLREILLANSVREKEEEESFADIVARRVGF